MHFRFSGVEQALSSYIRQFEPRGGSIIRLRGNQNTNLKSSFTHCKNCVLIVSSYTGYNLDEVWSCEFLRKRAMTMQLKIAHMRDRDSKEKTARKSTQLDSAGTGRQVMFDEDV